MDSVAKEDSPGPIHGSIKTLSLSVRQKNSRVAESIFQFVTPLSLALRIS